MRKALAAKIDFVGFAENNSSNYNLPKTIRLIIIRSKFDRKRQGKGQNLVR